MTTLFTLFVVLLCGAGIAPHVLAEEKTELLFVLLLTVVDGDTFETDGVLAFHGQDAQGRLMAVALSPYTKVRLNEVDAPEKTKPRCTVEKKRAEEAKRAAQRSIAFHGKRNLPPMIGLANISGDLYGGRVDAEVILPNNASLGDELMRRALARTYPNKRGWCK